MGCDIHMRAEVRENGAWRMLGEEFDSGRGGSDYYDFDSALVERLNLSDGELLDGLCFTVGYHEDAWQGLSEDARTAFWLYAEALSRDRARDVAAREDWRESLRQWDIENPEAAKEYGGWIGDDHPLAHRKVVAPEAERRTGERRRSVALAPGVRREIVAFFEAYRPYGDETRVDFNIDSDDQRKFLSREPWDGRNYDLFAMLADVRNGRGFAGVPTGEGFVPIAMPRNTPADASDDVLAYMASYGVDGHSHSYHDLAQLLAYDWDQGATSFGVVSADTYETLKAEGRAPSSYSGGISGAGIVTFSENGYARWKLAGSPDIGSQTRAPAFSLVGDRWPDDDGVIERPYHPGEMRAHVRMAWGHSYREAAGTAWFRTMDRLAELIPAGGDATDVRVVFFFDN